MFLVLISIVVSLQTEAQQTELMSDNVKSIGTILNELISEGATNEPGRYQQRVDTLVTRFRQILQAIDETSQRCSVIVPAKLLHENSSTLIDELNRMANVSNACRDLAEVHAAVNQQNRFCEHLRTFQGDIRDVLHQGNELSRQPGVPKYVQQDLQTLQKLYQEKNQSAQEVLAKLKVRRDETNDERGGERFRLASVGIVGTFRRKPTSIPTGTRSSRPRSETDAVESPIDQFVFARNRSRQSKI